MKKILFVVGNRPQFIKLSPLIDFLDESGDLRFELLHTGQHYNPEMSDIFFNEFKIPYPDINLSINENTHGKQTGLMMIGIEDYLLKSKPEMVLVFGDTNSTLAGALAAAKLNIPVGHVESGLRSNNFNMPEEINRVVTDSISTLLFCPTINALNNLQKENVKGTLLFTGDIMYDALLKYKEKAVKQHYLKEDYYICTIHRNYNTDDELRLKRILNLLNEINFNIVLPIHPRTKNRLRDSNISLNKNIMVIEPVGYLEMLGLMIDSKKIITDSGGIQKEAYFLKKPCITFRTETEWVETTNTGWNTLVDIYSAHAIETINTFNPADENYQNNLFGDGNSAFIIYNSILKLLS